MSFTASTGPDGRSNSAMTVADGNTHSLGSYTFGTGEIYLWCDSTPELTVNSVSPSFTSFDSYGGFTLYYATGITDDGELVIAATGSDKAYFDIRGFNDVVITADQRQYLFDDIKYNEGDATLPWF